MRAALKMKQRFEDAPPLLSHEEKEAIAKRLFKPIRDAAKARDFDAVKRINPRGLY